MTNRIHHNALEQAGAEPGPAWPVREHAPNTITTKKVAARLMTIRFARGDNTFKGEMNTLTDLIMGNWYLPQPPWDAWEFLLSRGMHRLTREEFKASQFWKDFLSAADMLRREQSR